MKPHTSILEARTIDGLRRARGQWPRIAEEADVSYPLICKLAGGAGHSTTSARLERIYRALVRRGLVEPQVDFSDAA